MSRNQTRAVRMGPLTIGGGAPIAVQSMAATKTQDVEATARLAVRLTAPVIASGGVTSLDDLRAVKAAAGSGYSTDESSALLYGCLWPANRSAVGATSTIFPRYMTAIREQTLRTAVRSWEMNR